MEATNMNQYDYKIFAKDGGQLKEDPEITKGREKTDKKDE
jgi:hypothetical protein